MCFDLVLNRVEILPCSWGKRRRGGGGGRSSSGLTPIFAIGT